MAPGQRGLDRGLALQEPVQRSVKFIFIDLTEPEHFAEARCGGGRRQRTCGSEFGRRLEDATDDEGEDKVSAAIAAGAENRVEPDVAGDAERGGDMTVWQAADDAAHYARRHVTVPPFNTPRRPSMWAVGQSERLHSVRATHLAAFAVALAQQDRGRRVPIPNSFDVHAGMLVHIRPKRTSLKYGITWLQPEWDQPASRILSTTSPQKRPEARARAR